MELFKKKVFDLITSENGKLRTLGPLIYGTAGFRMNYNNDPDRIHQVIMICTLISILRSITEKKWVGIMLTASHNPIQDNGVKLIDFTGSMLDKEFEEICFNVVNTIVDEDNNPIQSLVLFYEKKFFKNEKFNDLDLSNAKLIIGYDSRPSSLNMLKCIERVINTFNISNYLNFGYSTTPQIHFMVAFANGIVNHRASENLKTVLKLNEHLKNLENLNTENSSHIVSSFFDIYYGYHKYYFSKLLKLLIGRNANFTISQNFHYFKNDLNDNNLKLNNTGEILVDVANGVAKYHVDKFSRILKLINIHLVMINGDDPNKLNDECGAEYIQKNVLAPKNFYSNSSYNPERIDYVVAFDGDADRIIYFVPDLSYKNESKPKIFLIDGDRLSTCYAIVIVDILNKIVRNIKFDSNNLPILTFGIVQTAYSNGASTKYFKDLISALDNRFFKSNICCVPTGVKHLHRESEKYDIAIYFESNGHGTVIHKKNKLNNWLEEINKLYAHNNSFDTLNKDISYLCELLESFLNIFNPVIGDAISDLLAFEISRIYIQGNNFGCKFAIGVYDDLCVLQDKIELERCKLDKLVCDKKTEQFLVEPKELQEKIDSYIMSLNDKFSRAFIRPSGTEQVARIYVEASNLSLAKEIMVYVKNQIYLFFKNI